MKSVQLPLPAVAEQKPLGPPSPRRTRAVDLAVYLCLTAVALLEVCLYQRIEDVHGDPATYMGLAHSLLAHRGYVFDFKPHTQYPPGFPAILASIGALFGAGYPVFIRLMPVFAALGLCAAYAVLRQAAGRAAAATACLLLATSPYVFGLATRRIGPEFPYLLVSMLALLAIHGAERAATPPRRLAWWTACLVLVPLSVMIRSVGVALLGGLLAWLAVSGVAERRVAGRRLARFLPVLAVGLGVQLLWMAWAHRAARPDWPGQYMGTGYLRVLMMADPHRPELGQASAVAMLGRLPGNLLQQSAHLSELITRLDWVEPLWFSPLVLAPIVLVGLGLWASSGPLPGYLEWYFAAYMGILLLWPFDEGPRFILPASPLALLYLWRGGGWLAQQASTHRRRLSAGARLLFGALSVAALASVLAARHRMGFQAQASLAFWVAATGFLFASGSAKLRAAAARTGRVLSLWSAGAVAVAVLVVFGAYQQLEIGMRNLHPDPTKFRSYPAVDAGRWLAAGTAPNDVVLTGQAAIISRVSGRRTVGFPVTDDARFLMRVLRAQRVGYLVVFDTEKDEYFLPPEVERLRALLRAQPQAFRLVHTGPRYRIFRVVSAAARDRKAAAVSGSESGMLARGEPLR